ncbi:MAG: hypothetical protein WBD55_05470 [Dehalococcoidia bacterium]
MSGEAIGPGSLKLVTASSSDSALGSRVQTALERHVRPEDVRHIHDDAFVVFTESDAATIRDWLAPLLRHGESVFVVEFERWSGRGSSISREWLLGRGH